MTTKELNQELAKQSPYWRTGEALKPTELAQRCLDNDVRRTFRKESK